MLRISYFILIYFLIIFKLFYFSKWTLKKFVKCISFWLISSLRLHDTLLALTIFSTFSEYMLIKKSHKKIKNIKSVFLLYHFFKKIVDMSIEWYCVCQATFKLKLFYPCKMKCKSLSLHRIYNMAVKIELPFISTVRKKTSRNKVLSYTFIFDRLKFATME